jgi:uncharacterized alpha/beta hydrolase family protein
MLKKVYISFNFRIKSLTWGFSKKKKHNKKAICPSLFLHGAGGNRVFLYQHKLEIPCITQLLM